MKPYGAREPYTHWIECYCRSCKGSGLTSPKGRSLPAKNKALRTGKRRERRRGKRATQED